MSKKFDALEARKELLMMKAQLERMEFGGQVDTLKKEFAWVNVFRQFGGWLGQRNMRALGPVVSLGGQFWQDGLKSIPCSACWPQRHCCVFDSPFPKWLCAPVWAL